jgi:diguanylate cyclase (GGDEF)-like protein
LSKANKTYLVYAGLGLIPVFLDLLLPTKVNGDIVHAFANFFQYPLYMGFALVGFLGWKLNQNRILFSVLLFLGACYCLFNPILIDTWNTGRMVRGLYFIVAMSLPLTLAVVFSFRETRLMDLQYLGRLTLSLVPIVILSYLLARDKEFFIEIAYFKFLPLNGFLLPQLSLMSLAIFILVVLLKRDHKVKPYLNVIGISLIPLMSAIWAGLRLFSDISRSHPKTNLQPFVEASFPSLHMVVAFTVICGILLHTIFQMYWHRVYVDELTDIPNRRALDERLAKLSGEYAIAMLDIDHFKAFNDNYGHDEGDNVLRLVGSVLSQELGSKVYRYGGEEFCAVFKGVLAEDAYMYANKVRRKLEEREFYIRKPNSKREPTSSFDRRRARKNGKKVQITISIGLANPNKKSKTASDVVKLADQALYEAKRKGRNRVIIWEVEGVKSAV